MQTTKTTATESIAPSHHSQWLFPISTLSCTPTAQERSLHEEMYDRSRGIEFLFRLGTTIGLHSPGLFTAATWFHRFFMRYSMLDYHRQTIAAACIFLATKTEECGRKLRDVARVCQSKAKGVDVRDIPENGPEIEEVSSQILAAEEVLLEALCFDFVIDSPHADLVDLFEAHEASYRLQDHAWSIAHDSYRTPLCVLYPSKIIAATCYILSQRIVDGPHSLVLGCSRVGGAAIGVTAYSSDPQAFIA
ncbi:cyclin-like protein [Russula earlei]|uniref:Cyclin-like protein n=1 Tax=Russula earlei TaxID=71964 RepID=A0ACC0UET9_9AGAM|nr:cyclin-like protein [Russula earlei]